MKLRGSAIDYLKFWWWRLRYACHFFHQLQLWREVKWSIGRIWVIMAFCWQSACTDGAYENFCEGETPKEAVSIELSYWTD